MLKVTEPSLGSLIVEPGRCGPVVTRFRLDGSRLETSPRLDEVCPETGVPVFLPYRGSSNMKIIPVCHADETMRASISGHTVTLYCRKCGAVVVRLVLDQTVAQDLAMVVGG